jgi:hypothetical protein
MFDSSYFPQRFEHERSKNLEHSLPYDKSSMASHCVALDDLVQEYFLRCDLVSLAKTKSPKATENAHQRLKRHLRSLLWNLVRAARIHEDCYLRIPLGDSHYRARADGNPHQITRTILSPIIVRLEQCGHLQRHSGFLDRRTRKSRHTRIRPCLSLLDDLKMLPGDLAEDYVVPPAVSIRKGTPTTLDYASAAHLARMTRTVAQQNEMLRGHSITLGCAKGDVLHFLDKENNRRCLLVTSKPLRAIYHADIPNKLTYGRIHGGLWQQIPSVFRKEILIDGEPTVELDYSAQIPHIVAGLQKIELEGDPYTISLDLPIISDATRREVVKSVVVVALNASDRKSLLRGVRGKLCKLPWASRSGLALTDKSLEPIIDAILDALPYLNPFILKGRGKELFMHDAEIARRIIQTFLDAGKVVLPIHDGFVTKRSDADFLHDTMQQVWKEMFGTTIAIKVEN